MDEKAIDKLPGGEKKKGRDDHMFCPKRVNSSDKMFPAILAAVLILGSIIGFALSRNEPYVETVNEIIATFGKEKIVTNHVTVAEEVLGEEVVTVEIIKNAIAQNPNMGPRYKDLANKLLDNIVSVEPEFNLRIFYENIQSLTVIIVDEEEGQQNENYTHYDAKKNIIYVKRGSDDPTVCHQLMCLTRSLYRITEENVLIVCDNTGWSLNEAVIDSMIATMYSGYEGSHYERKVLDYMLGIEEIDYEQYSKYGVAYLTDDFKIKYRDVDIDFIVHYYDTKAIRDSRFNDTIRLEDNRKVCDELFLVCVHNIDPLDVYLSFKSFLELLGHYSLTTLTSYQTRFNQYLESRGLNNSLSSKFVVLAERTW